MEDLEEYVGKKVKIVYKDVELGKETRAVKIGRLVKVGRKFVHLSISDSEEVVVIPIRIIQRIEVVKSEKG
jgi:ribosome maturation factor RimP